MSILYRSFRYLFAPIMLTLVGLSAVQIYYSVWEPWQTVINELPYFLLLISAVLASQFNCSRLSYLAILLTLYYASQRGVFFTPDLLSPYGDQVLLTGSLIITLFSLSKDRGLLSVHSIKRVIGIALCFVFAFGWLEYLSNLGLESEVKLPFAISLMTKMFVPLLVLSLVVSIYTVWRANSIDSAVAITLLIWLFNYYLPDELPLSLLLSMLAILYLTTVLIESYYLAYRDELTGLSSRRALNTLALSLSNHYSVAMVDIDHFKRFNDTYGHDVGDQVLRLIGSKLDKVGGGGRVFRYGGEEFVIIYAGKDAEVILPHLEELRRRIFNYHIVLRDEQRKQSTKSDRHASSTIRGRSVGVTISIGVAEHCVNDTFNQTIKRADKALYIAKKNGRNRIFL